MAQTTIEHLLTAIEEGLTTITGKPRALTSTQLFGQGLPRGVDPGLRSTRCLEAANRKTAFVDVPEMLAPEAVADELGSEHLYVLSLTISRDYHLDYEYSHTTVKALMKTVADDFMLVRKALCHPSSLDATSAAVATGIAHGGLRSSGATSTVRYEAVGEGRHRLVNALDRFTCAFLFTPGS